MKQEILKQLNDFRMRYFMTESEVKIRLTDFDKLITKIEDILLKQDKLKEDKK